MKKIEKLGVPRICGADKRIRRMLEWIAPQEYTTNSTDDGQAYGEAWQAQNQITQNDTVRFLYTE